MVEGCKLNSEGTRFSLHLDSKNNMVGTRTKSMYKTENKGIAHRGE